MCQVLLPIQEDHVNNHTFCATKEKRTLQYMAWAYHDWIEECQRNGIVLGVSLDCKAVSKRFGVPIVAIHGLDNGGSVLTYL